MFDRRPNTQKFDDLVALARDVMQHHNVPGVAIGLLSADEEFTAGLGETNVDHPLPVTPETLFLIGSTTKTFTATAIFHLIEQGKIGLDDCVRKFLPDFKLGEEETAARVTIRNLLNHTGGWVGDYAPDTGEGDDALVRFIESVAELPQQTPLGALFTYNNSGFVIAGRIIEVVTGKPYEEAIREIILDPLGMSNSFFFPMEVMVHRFAAGHVQKDGKLSVYKPWSMNRGMTACGGRLASDVHDQLRYARFHLGESCSHGASPIGAASLNLMQTPSATAEEGWMGLNWFIKDIGSVRIMEHGGSTNGQQSAFWFAPQQKVAFTVLTNEDRGYILHEELTRWVYEHFLGAVKARVAAIQLTEGQIGEYAGGYTLKASGDVLDFRTGKQSLVMTHTPGAREGADENPPDALPPMDCAIHEHDRFTIINGPFEGLPGEFIRDAQGKIAWLRFSNRIFARLREAR
jgi:CubicO group peptidase (beta-lactamase class C family)